MTTDLCFTLRVKRTGVEFFDRVGQSFERLLTVRKYQRAFQTHHLANAGA